MRDKTIWKILGFLMVFVMIGSCMAMPAAGDESPDLIVSIAGPDWAIAGETNIDLEVIVSNVGSAPAPAPGIFLEYRPDRPLDLILM